MVTNSKMLKAIQNYFGDKPVIKAYLFGSYAREEQDNDSDIDILVDLDHSVPIGMDFFGWKIDLEKILKQKVDLVSSKAVSKYIKPYIEQDKKLIYERENRR